MNDVVAPTPSDELTDGAPPKRRWLRWFLYLFCAGIVTVVLVVITFPLWSREWIRAKAEEGLTKGLEADARLESFRWGWFGPIELGPTEIVKKNGSLTASWSKARVDVSPLSLMFAQNRVELGDRVVLQDLTWIQVDQVEANEDTEEESDTTEDETSTAEYSGPDIIVVLPTVEIDVTHVRLDEQKDGVTTTRLDLKNAKVRLELRGSELSINPVKFEPEELLAQLEGPIEVTAESIVAPDVNVGNARLHGEAKDGRIDLTLDRTEFNDGTVEGTVAVHDGRWSTNLTAKDVVTSGELVDMLAHVSPVFVYIDRLPAELKCRVGTQGTQLSGTLDDPTGSLTGTGNIAISAGRIRVPPELSPLLGLLREEDRKKLDFKPFLQPFDVADGKVLNRGFNLASGASSFIVEGYTTVTGDLNHTVRLDKIVRRELEDRVGKRELAAIEMLANDPLILQGTVAEPELILPETLRTVGRLFGFPGSDKKNGEKDGDAPLEDLIKTGLDIFRKRDDR